MAEHEVVALHQSFEKWKIDRAAGLSDVEPFLYYSVENITKQYNLSDEQIRYGITDDKNDGGIDAFYCLAGKKNTLLRDDIDTAITGAETIRILIFQVKSSLSKTGFEPEDIDLFTHFADYLLTLGPIDIQGQYTQRILTRMQTFKDKFLEADLPRLVLEFYYVTRGDEVTVNQATTAAQDRLYAAIEKHRGTQSGDEKELILTDTGKLLTFVKKRRQQKRTLRWTQQPIPIGDGYIGLARLTDYFNFLKDEKGDLDELIFESNVRGSQGSTPVNKRIRATLDKDEKGGDDATYNIDFWKLNNGMTITCQSITPIDALSLSVLDAQVVNGLQTSRQIFAHFDDPKTADTNDSRLVMLKLIPVTEDAARDAIIRATNNQNSLKASALRATDEKQRTIQNLFERFDLFYDRRPGYYKDQGKEIDKIVSLNEIVQALVSLVVHRPDDARARPGDYVKEGRKWDAKYNSIFGKGRKPAYPWGIYLRSVLIVRRVAKFLEEQEHLTRGDRHNLLFYVAYQVVCERTQNTTPTAEEILAIETGAFTKTRLENSLTAVWELYMKLALYEENPDVVAKGTELLAGIKKELENTYGSRTPVSPPIKGARKIRDIVKESEVKPI